MNPKRELRRHIQYLVSAPSYRRFGQYLGFADFVLQHGVWYKPRPQSGQPVSNGESFASAFCRAACDGVPYVEGFVLTYGIALHHAWNLDVDGSVNYSRCTAKGSMGSRKALSGPWKSGGYRAGVDMRATGAS